MYQSVPSTFGISVTSGASRWLEAVARGSAVVSAAPTRAIAHIAGMILAVVWLAIPLAVLIGLLPNFAHGYTHETLVGLRDEPGADLPRRPDCHRRLIYEGGARIGFRLK